MSSPFSMDNLTFLGPGHRLVHPLASYLDKLPREPVYRPLPAEVPQELEKMDLPAEGAAPETILGDFLPWVLAYGRGQSHPCLAALSDTAASKMSTLAAFASAPANTSGVGRNYAAVYVERAVIRWLMELIGFPRDWSGGAVRDAGRRRARVGAPRQAGDDMRAPEPRPALVGGDATCAS